MTHTGTQTITTPRLTLRRFRLDDAAAMYRNWATDEKTVKYLSWDMHESENLTRALLRQWIENYKSSEYYNWALEYEGEVIGNISIVRKSDQYYEFMEFGYCMGSRWWNLGLMSEGVSAAAGYLFRETGINRLVIRHAAENIASGKVAEKCGFSREGIERGAYVGRDGRHMDIVVNSLLKSEWERMGTQDRLVLETERLILRPMTTEDFDDAYTYMGNEENTKFMFSGVSDEKETRHFLESCERIWAKDELNIVEFAMVDRSTSKVIGDIGLSPEDDHGYIWWILHRDYWNRGLTTEAAKEILRYGFETLGLKRIIATCDSGNIGSWRVMEKLGMEREAVYRKTRPNGHDEYAYAILREEWETRND